jgi:thymidylate synthase (FAD)
MKKIPVLDQGFVSVEYMAPDLNPELHIVNAARVSFAQRAELLGGKDRGLLKFLMKHRHGTPFEMVEFCFHIRCPIFVAREWHRHRIASYNEMSGRYVKLEADYYVPEGDAIRTQKGKAGAYYYEPIKSWLVWYCPWASTQSSSTRQTFDRSSTSCLSGMMSVPC